MAEEKKSKAQQLHDKLIYTNKNAWHKVNKKESENVFEFCEDYKKFLDSSKTERECVNYIEKTAREKGFQNLDNLIEGNKTLNPGDKIYAVNKNKNIILCVIGSTPLEQGINMIGSHLDAPRLDLKQNPLYEDCEIALLKTHYYGGIKKYQWTAIPLALHGLIITSDGKKAEVNIGEDTNDPKFCVTDLLPHLAQEQMQKKMTEGITGEGLNILFGSIPYNDEKISDKVKLNILDILSKKYGITEEDFKRAELEVVPAFKAYDIGLDRSMVGSYGQDDRVCAYTSLQAILGIQKPSKTVLCFFTDKEEIGSTGNTGMQSRFFENTIAEICELMHNSSGIILRRTLSRSKFLSADVTAVVDPTYESVNDKRNSVFLGKGVAIAKYSGSRGKYDANDTNPEFVGEITNLLNDNNVLWQSGELGKVDQGGGATIAHYAAKYGMEAIDIGTGLLSMHAPYEIASKIDIYMTYKAFSVFLEKCK